MAPKFTKLSRLAMRALPEGQRIVEHGIVYEKLANGDGRFEVCIQINGERIHRSVGKESDGTTRYHAEQLIERLKTEGRENRLKLPKGRKLPMTFQEAAGKYIARLEETEGRNLKAKRQQFRDHLAPFFGKTALSQISSFEVERFKRHLQDAGLTPATTNRYLAVLSHLFRKALEWEWIDAIPCKITKCKEPPGRIHYLTSEEAQRLLKVAKADAHPLIYLFIAIGLETAMRKMEILAIRLEHLDLDRQLLYIPQAKAGARTQPLSGNLVAILRDHLDRWVKPNQVWLFPSADSKPGHMVAIDKTYRRVVAAAGLDPTKIVRHTLRHTAITHLVQAGVDLPTVKRISGHKTLVMVERYTHLSSPHIQSALDKLSSSYKPD